MTEGGPELPAAHGGTDDRERQGATPAALFFRGIRRRLTGAALAIGMTLGRWIRRRRPYNVLRIELSGDLAERSSELHLRDLGRRPTPDLLTVLAALRSAREDPQVSVVVLDVHGLATGWGTIQTVRRAVGALRDAGKQVWAYLTQPGTRDYYLASAASRVFLAPAAVFDVTGLASEVTFLKGALDKLGVEAQLARAGRFKSAAEPFTRTEMSPEHRAMADALLDDLYDQLVGDVAKARRVTPDSVRAAFDDGPLLAAEARRRGLVDALAYPDEVRIALSERLHEPHVIDLAAYHRRRALATRRAALDAPIVGVMTVSGAIGGDGMPSIGGRGTKWRAFRREMQRLASDERVAAILVRVDSPGGSGLASDLMWREVVEARRKKPVVVSMGDVAASGGYYLAAGADHVTAEPGTLTGSIGVLAGKPVLRGLYDRIGVTKEVLVRGNAGRHSDYVPLDDVNLGRLRGEAEAFYADFVKKVATCRGLEPLAVERVAEGRVWTGRQALEHRLVDALGGIEQALDDVKRRLGMSPLARVALLRPTRRGALWRALVARLVPGEALAPGVASGAWLAGGADAFAAASLREVLALVLPLVRGERVLATMPFVVRFVPDGADVSAVALPRDEPKRSARARSLLAQLIDVLLPPPLVL